MSFQQALSGLNATSKSLEIIGNNIANSSTYGAKAARAEFSDVYAAALGGTGETMPSVSVSSRRATSAFCSTGRPACAAWFSPCRVSLI